MAAESPAGCTTAAGLCLSAARNTQTTPQTSPDIPHHMTTPSLAYDIRIHDRLRLCCYYGNYGWVFAEPDNAVGSERDLALDGLVRPLLIA